MTDTTQNPKDQMSLCSRLVLENLRDRGPYSEPILIETNDIGRMLTALVFDLLSTEGMVERTVVTGHSTLYTITPVGLARLP